MGMNGHDIKLLKHWLLRWEFFWAYLTFYITLETLLDFHGQVTCLMLQLIIVNYYFTVSIQTHQSWQVLFHEISVCPHILTFELTQW